MKSTAQAVYCDECIHRGLDKAFEWRWCEKPLSEFTGGYSGSILKFDKNYFGQCKDFRELPKVDSWINRLKRKWLK
jgi:hypothetical protein